MRSSTAAFAIAFSLATGMSLTAARPAQAQSDDDRATARALGVEGQQALARALAGEAKYVEAQEAYNRIIREGLPPSAPDVFKRALDDAKKEVETVSPKLGSVVITVKASNGQDIAEPKVVLDERNVNSASLGVKRAVDPGPHTLRVSADGYKGVEMKFTVLEGGSATEAISLEKDSGGAVAATPTGPATAPATGPATTAPPTPSGPTSTQPAPAAATADTGEAPKKSLLPWIAFGVGGAGLLMGAITGAIAMGDHGSIAKNCSGSTCPSDQSGAISSYHTMGLLSTVGFIVAGVGGATGAVLLLTQPKEGATAAVKGVRLYPTVGLGSAGVSGTF
jgi:hypothetical protein